MDPVLAALDSTGEFAAAETASGLQARTDHTIDFCQTALVVLIIIYGCIFASLDPSCYDFSLPEESFAFLQAWRDFTAKTCPAIQALPEDVASFVCWYMDADPTARPQTGAEALQHPFLAGAVQQLQATAEDAAAEWDKAHDDLHALLLRPSWQPIPMPDTPQTDRQ
jgi:hypothetical protein